MFVIVVTSRDAPAVDKFEHSFVAAYFLPDAMKVRKQLEGKAII